MRGVTAFPVMTSIEMSTRKAKALEGTVKDETQQWGPCTCSRRAGVIVVQEEDIKGMLSAMRTRTIGEKSSLNLFSWDSSLQTRLAVGTLFKRMTVMSQTRVTITASVKPWARYGTTVEYSNSIHAIL